MKISILNTMVNLLITQNTSFVGIVSHYKEEGRREWNVKKKKVALNKTEYGD